MDGLAWLVACRTALAGNRACCGCVAAHKTGCRCPLPGSRLFSNDEYPYWSSWIFTPFSLIPKKGIYGDNQLSHNGFDRQIFAFPGRYQLFVFCFHVWIEACGNNRWQIDCAPDAGATALDAFLALPLSRLPRYGCKARQRRCLLAAQMSEFGHFD